MIMKSFIFSFPMKISVVIASRSTEKSIPNLKHLFTCLEHQTFKDFEVILVCDRIFTKETFESFQQELWTHPLFLRFITNLNSSFIPQSSWGASAGRNRGIQQAQGEFIQLFDDDNVFEKEYFEKELQRYETLKKEKKSELLLCPTLQYRDTWIIQNQGFSSFCYRQARPKIHFLQEQNYAEIQMFSGNGIFGKKEVLQSVPYDEEIARIAEDIEFTLTIHEKGNTLYVLQDLKVQHYEREKTILEQARIGSQVQAKQKTRNRFLFVRRHGNFIQKLQFFLIGLPWCLLRLSCKALKYGKQEKRNIIKGLFQGVFEGMRRFFHNTKKKNS